MATISNISTGEQSVSGAGAITGTLDTSALSGDYTVKLRVQGLASGQSVLIAIEDTANASAFSDTRQVALFHAVGGMGSDGVYNEWRKGDIPVTRFGVTNAKLRANCLAISGGTAKVTAWLEQ